MTWPFKKAEPCPEWRGHAEVAREGVQEAIVEAGEAAHGCDDAPKKTALERAVKALETARSELGRALSLKPPKETP